MPPRPPARRSGRRRDGGRARLRGAALGSRAYRLTSALAKTASASTSRAAARVSATTSPCRTSSAPPRCAATRRGRRATRARKATPATAAPYRARPIRSSSTNSGSTVSAPRRGRERGVVVDAEVAREGGRPRPSSRSSPRRGSRPRRRDPADEARHDVEHALARAQYGMSAVERRPWLIRFRPLREAPKRLLGRRVRRRQPDRRLGRVAAIVAEQGRRSGRRRRCRRARRLPLTPAQKIATSSPCARAAAVTASRLSSDAIRHALATLGGGHDRTGAVRRRHGQGRESRTCRYSRGRVAEIESLDPHAEPLATERHPPADGERARVLHLGGAEHALVARGERLADRRGGPDHIDHDPVGAAASSAGVNAT